MKITNGKDVFQVTRGAYENIYKKQGFVLFEESGDRNQKSDGMDGNADDSNKMTDDEKFLADITVKPISQWSNDELQRYAQLKSIPIPAKAKELRTVIQKELENLARGHAPLSVEGLENDDGH